MPPHALPTGSDPLHVSLVAVPEAAVSTLTGIFDVMNAFTLMSRLGEASFEKPPFQVDIVGLRPGPLDLASQVPVTLQRSIGAIDATDIVIVPSIVLGADGWQHGRP